MARNTARLSYAFGEAVTAFRTALDQPAANGGDESPAAHGLGNWAARRLEKRVRRELATCEHTPEVKWKWLRRADPPARTQNFRSLVQVNFYRYPRRWRLVSAISQSTAIVMTLGMLDVSRKFAA
ncbi:MAG TPA: hypothetical protein VFU13_08610 [Steroidobacteraceae bacterium]|nr:hypothetical protein [Steroidobacteraceae bacterium]